MTPEDKEELIELETILIALDDKLHRIQSVLTREHIRLKEIKERK